MSEINSRDFLKHFSYGKRFGTTTTTHSGLCQKQRKKAKIGTKSGSPHIKMRGVHILKNDTFFLVHVGHPSSVSFHAIGKTSI